MYNRYDFFIISGCRNGTQCITTNIFHDSFLDWLLHLENRGIRVFEDDILKSHAMLCLDISKIEELSGTLDSKLTDDGLFYVDNVGEEEKASEEDKHVCRSCANYEVKWQWKSKMKREKQWKEG